MVIDSETGIAKRGLLVRHLVLPNDQAGTDAIAEFLATNIGNEYSDYSSSVTSCTGVDRGCVQISTSKRNSPMLLALQGGARGGVLNFHKKTLCNT